MPRSRRRSLLLDGLAANFSEGYSAGLPILRRALSPFERETSAEDELRWLWLACVVANNLWDDARWDTLSSRHLELARDTGALSQLPLALSRRAYVLLLAGELATAASLVVEAELATEATGSNLAPYGARFCRSMITSVWSGRTRDRGTSCAEPIATPPVPPPRARRFVRRQIRRI